MDNVRCEEVRIESWEWKWPMMSPRDGQGDQVIVAALDRHDQRRRCSVPAVSVLVGPAARALRSVQAWAETLDRSVLLLRLEHHDPKAAVAPWVDELVEHHDVIGAAVEWLARQLNRAAGPLDRSLRGMTRYEVRMFLESVLPLESDTGIERVSKGLIELAAVGVQSVSPGLALTLNSLLEGYGRPWIRVFRAMGELVCPECLPILSLTPAGQDVTRLERIARLLAELALAQPRVALALLVEPRQFEAYLAHAPVSRAKSLLRQSVVTLSCPGSSPEVNPITIPGESQKPVSLESMNPTSRDPDFQHQESGIRTSGLRDLGSGIWESAI
jgi:hypothetical protein